MKKKEGSIQRFGVPLFTLVGVFLIVLISLYAHSDVYKKVRVDSISREYILKMETEGYLSNTNKSTLISDLNRIGMKNIVFNNTTFSRVGYGSDVNLSFVGDLEISQFEIKSLFSANRKIKTIKVPIEKKSTAKH